MSMGLYAGLGYDFQTAAMTTSVTVASVRTETVTSYTLHNLLAGIGFDFGAGLVRVRPEISFLFSPAVSASTQTNNVTTTVSGGTGFVIFPNVTIAAAK